MKVVQTAGITLPIGMMAGKRLILFPDIAGTPTAQKTCVRVTLLLNGWVYIVSPTDGVPSTFMLIHLQ